MQGNTGVGRRTLQTNRRGLSRHHESTGPVPDVPGMGARVLCRVSPAWMQEPCAACPRHGGSSARPSRTMPSSRRTSFSTKGSLARAGADSLARALTMARRRSVPAWAVAPVPSDRWRILVAATAPPASRRRNRCGRLERKRRLANDRTPLAVGAAAATDWPPTWATHALAARHPQKRGHTCFRTEGRKGQPGSSSSHRSRPRSPPEW